MSQRPVTDAQMDEAIAAVTKHRTVSAAARSLGMPRPTFKNRLAAAKRRDEQNEPIPLDTKPFLRKLKAKKPRRLVVTWAQNATPIHERFFAALKVYCREHRAQLVVIPGRYKNPTSDFPERDEDTWDVNVIPYLLAETWHVNANLAILAGIKIQPTAVNPLSGLQTISGSRSAIFGHSKIELEAVATPHERMAKVLQTTGACTVRNYTDSKAGKKGEFHHALGAALIEVDGAYFYPRQINALNDGSFIDLDREYTHTGSRRAAPPEAIMLGDEHARFSDPQVREATFGKGGIVPTLKPKRLIRQDVHDSDSANHHDRKKTFTRFAKHLQNRDDVAGELRETVAYLDATTPPGVQNIIIASNHHDHLRRWVEEDHDPRSDMKNLMVWAELFQEMGKAALRGRMLDPFAWYASRHLKCAKRTRFLKRDESCRIAGIEVGYHGDQGLNGARGNLRQFNKIGAKTITGHSHTPGIHEGAYAVGTSSRLRLDYNQGPSSWLHTHCVVYSNGKRSLLSIINGRWKL